MIVAHFFGDPQSKHATRPSALAILPISARSTRSSAMRLRRGRRRGTTRGPFLDKAPSPQAPRADLRQTLEVREARRAQLLKSSVRELHLAFGAARATRKSVPVSAADSSNAVLSKTGSAYIARKGGLPRRFEQPFQDVALALAVDKLSAPRPRTPP